MASSLLDMPPNVLDQIVRSLPGNDRKPLRASCRELRCLANEATDFLCVDVSNATQWKELREVPSSLVPYIKSIRLKLPEKFLPIYFQEAVAILNIASTRPDTQIQLVVGNAEASRHFLPTINFWQLVQCLARANIWQRVCQFSFSCEQWVGPEVSFGPGIMVRAHIRLSERDSRVNRKLLHATLMQPGLTELTISEMLPQDLDADLVRMLGERHSTLTSLTLRVCDISEHDPDVPLIFDLRPLAQVRLPKLEHLAVESSCAGPVRLVAVDGLPCMLAQRSAPALRRVALKGLSQVPLSTARASQRRRSSPTSARQWPERLPHIPMAVPDFRPFSGLTALELSAWRLGNLALLPSLTGLERLVLRSLVVDREGCRRPRLSGNEFGRLLRLQHLVLDCLDCPHGLMSASLQHLELVNTDLCQVHMVTGYSMLPNLASMLITERARGPGEAQCCHDLTRLFVQAAAHTARGAVSLPVAWLPSSSEEHASKVRKMRAKAQACTCSGLEPAAQVRWLVHEVCCQSKPEPVQEAGDVGGQSLSAFRTEILQEYGESDVLRWRIPTNFSLRLIRHSV